MAGVRFTDLQSRPMEFLDFTSVTVDEFQQLVPPFEAAFHARMAARRMDGKPRTARQFAVDKNCPLPTPDDRLFFMLAYVQNLRAASRPRTPVRPGPAHSPSVDARPPPSTAGRVADSRRCPRPFPDGPGTALRRLGGRGGHGGHAAGGGGANARRRRISRSTGVPPFAHDGTERRIVRPQDPVEQTDCYSGKKKDHTVKNVLLVNALLLILFLSDTY